MEIEISDRREAWRIAMKTFAIAIAREMGDVAEEAGAQDAFFARTLAYSGRTKGAVLTGVAA